MKREKSKSCDKERPFVIGVVMSTLFGDFIVPAGVVLASCPRAAWKEATRRWPERTVIRLFPWEELDPSIRLAALEADRQM